MQEQNVSQEQQEIDQFSADVRPVGANLAVRIWEAVFLPIDNFITRVWNYIWGVSVEQDKVRYISEDQSEE